MAFIKAMKYTGLRLPAHARLGFTYSPMAKNET